jgi:hypothetical protein
MAFVLSSVEMLSLTWSPTGETYSPLDPPSHLGRSVYESSPGESVPISGGARFDGGALSPGGQHSRPRDDVGAFGSRSGSAEQSHRRRPFASRGPEGGGCRIYRGVGVFQSVVDQCDRADEDHGSRVGVTEPAPCCTNSINVPPVDLGWMNATVCPRAPGRGASSMSWNSRVFRC